MRLAAEGTLLPGGVEITPFGEIPGGLAKIVERLCGVAFGAPGEAREGPREGWRRGGEAALNPTLEHRIENAQGVGLG